MFRILLRLMILLVPRSLIALAWMMWWLSPERPLREWHIKGEFGVLASVIDVENEKAIIHTTTRPPYTASWNDRHRNATVCYPTSPPKITANLLDLLTGQLITATDKELFDNLTEWRRLGNFFDVPEMPQWPMTFNREDKQWMLRDAETNAVLATHQCEAGAFVSKPRYDADKKWLTIGEDLTDVPENDLRLKLRYWLNWPSARTENVHLLVFDPSTGKKINDVTSWAVCRWAPNRDQFWTADNMYSRKGDLSGVTVRLWSDHAAPPPWWLWSLTIGGVVWYVHRFRQRQRLHFQP